MGDEEVGLSITIGLAEFAHTDDADSVLSRAKAALAEALATGKNETRVSLDGRFVPLAEACPA